MNSNLDNTPNEYINPPQRMPNTEWDKYESDKNNKRKGRK